MPRKVALTGLCCAMMRQSAVDALPLCLDQPAENLEVSGRCRLDDGPSDAWQFDKFDHVAVAADQADVGRRLVDDIGIERLDTDDSLLLDQAGQRAINLSRNYPIALFDDAVSYIVSTERSVRPVLPCPQPP